MNKQEHAKASKISTELDDMYKILEELKENCIPSAYYNAEQYDKIASNIEELLLHMDNIGNITDYLFGIRDIKPNKEIIELFKQ